MPENIDITPDPVETKTEAAPPAPPPAPVDLGGWEQRSPVEWSKGDRTIILKDSFYYTDSGAMSESLEGAKALCR